MIACKHCATPNSLDSLFCRRCGTSFPPDEIASAREKNEALVAEGLRMFNEGKTADASAVAETAHAADPSSVAALSLKGMIHERNGELAEALEAFEQIVELNPDSALDRIKLNQLRNTLAHKAEEVVPDRKVATIMAVGAALLVVGLGGLVAVLQNRPAPVASTSAGDPVLIERFPDPGQGSPTGTQVQTPQQNPSQALPEDPNPIVTNPSNPRPEALPRAERSFRDQNLPTVPTGQLPTPSGGSSFNPLDPGQAPIEINPRDLQPVSPPTAGRSADPDPTPTRGTGTSAEEKPADPPPIMEMSVRNTPGGGARTGGGAGTGGGGEAQPGETGVQAMVRTANAQFQVGSYGQAAATFERALRAGADPGSTNQRLGQTYERLGRRNDAIIAYDRAAQALEAQIASGRGTDRTRAALESVKAARRALGGG